MKALVSFLSSKKGSLSSKRLCGVLGWLVCLIIMGYCAIAEKQAPLIADSIIIASSVLLGVDSITNIWKNGKETR